jgi:hypothetical protein
VKTIAFATFARPANTTAYTVGDIVANHATAASVIVAQLDVSPIPGVPVSLDRVRLEKSNNSLVNASFRVHFFKSAPAVTSGDNAAIAVAGRAAGYIGKADIVMDQSFTDGAFGVAAVSFAAQLASGSKRLYAVIEALGAYTPASAEQFTVTLEGER